MAGHQDVGATDRSLAALLGVRLLAVARLIRIEYCALGAAGVLVGAFLTTGRTPTTPTFLSTVAVFFVAAGCYSFDDLSDMDCDRLNARTDRPLIAGDLSTHTAMAAGTVSLVLALAATLMAGTAAGLLIAAGVITAMVYNRWLRGVLVLKNVLFAAVFPVPLVIGWLASGGMFDAFFAYTLVLVFVVGLGFETMIDIADAEGDRLSGIETLATRYGTSLSARLAAGLHVAAAVLVLLLYVLPLDARLQWNPFFLLPAGGAALSNSLIGLRLIRDRSSSHVMASKHVAFVTISAGLAAIILGLLLGTY
jgi:4-hydroxybenzoate polyprenyltransferase